MLGAKPVNDPKTKVVPLAKHYNFALVHTSMQSLYHIVQTWSNTLHSQDDLYMNYDLVTNLALTMNTKVVHNDLLNMFNLFVRSQTHFMHWSHLELSRST